MKLLGFDIGRAKNAVPAEIETKSASSLMSGFARGWLPIIREPFGGAWQRNVHVDYQAALSFHAVFACITLIASDIAKLRVKLVQQDANGIWSETTSPAYSPVLRKPNRYQNRIQFWEQWIMSKLIRGNTYVLKERDSRNVVIALYVLNPDRCCPLIANDGSVWYELQPDRLSGLPTAVMVPAREIIHDRMYAIDGLCGVSPIYAAGLSATLGLQIQNHSARFFGNNSQPAGILTSESRIVEADAKLMKEQWEENFGGNNFGRVAVLGGGLKFVQLSMTATDAQLIDQHKWTAENVCGVFHVPGYKVGIGAAPLNNNVQALEVQYLSQCLQILFESAELCLDEGLGIGEGVGTPPYYGTEFDIDNLLRMDTEGQMRALKDSTETLTIDERRSKVGVAPLKIGGDTVYLQEQNYSVEALAKRDALDNPFGAKGFNNSPDTSELPPPDTTKAIDPETEALIKVGRAYQAASYLGELLNEAA